MNNDKMKYDVQFCSCGRVHFIPTEKINNAIENDKEVLVVCNNCGNSHIIGADRTQDYEGKECFMMYSFDKRDTEINNTSKIDSIIFTPGVSVRMMTGGEATFHVSDTFIDWHTKKPDNVTNEQWEKLRKTVDVQSTINWISDENKLEQMSNYMSGIDWKGTKYEKQWHK